MSLCVCRALCRAVSGQSSSFLLGEHRHAAQSPWFAPVMTLKTSAPLRAEPKKKKKVDPKKDQLIKDRLKKKVKKLEKIPPELIPIEDFSQAKYVDKTRQRFPPRLSFEESERRAKLLKDWSRYKQEQHMAEMKAVKLALEAQREALQELKLESEELYQAALKPDPLLFPFTREGLAYTPPKATYYAPDGKYNNITKVYTQ
ncbi:39S ribosomal protein L40, mitochondrial [Dicentrarchus labrax]|uniref:Large ribosomal subunit protein mL40 n=1 Tax=Dicentrarchus labrax TaxID=13489 RepID=A0A8P4KLU7_DICLA|nr:39S ribosomal protein L40, mitochondrial [Dicentrarchus labrax]